MSITLSVSFWLHQRWLRHVRGCDSWQYRVAFDDPDHQGEEKHVFEGKLWAYDDQHAAQVQARLNHVYIAYLHRKQNTASTPNSWMGLRYDPTTKKGLWPVKAAAGVRNVGNSMHKGWSPGGLKPGLLLRLVYHDMSEKLDQKIEQAQQQKSEEQLISNMVWMFVFCLFACLGSLAFIVIAFIQGVTLSWGVLYAGFFVCVTFGLLSYGLVVRLQGLLKKVGEQGD